MDRRPRPSHLLLAATVLLAGCSVGPNYVRPDAPMTESYKELGGEWRGAPPRGRGGGRARAGANQNLAPAEARYRQARTLVRQARSNWYPTATVGVSFARSRVSSTLGGG